ncbi:MAG: hypothetical protein AB2L07_17280 [Thermoanaerobaculaceae bacterium]
MRKLRSPQAESVTDRRAIAGTVLGLLGTVAFGWLGLALFDETARLGASAGPLPFVLGSQVPATSRWVGLSGGRWDCARAVQAPRSLPQAWLLGRVASTQVPVEGPPGAPTLVVKLDGAQECPAVAGTTVVGVLVPRPSWLWDRSVHRSLLMPDGRQPDLVLLAGEGPTALCSRCLGMLALTGVSTCLLVSSWRAWRRPARLRQTPGAAPA